MAAIPLPRDSIGMISFSSIQKHGHLFEPKCFVCDNLRSSIDNDLRNLVDFCFLENFNIPAMALLAEPKPTDPWYVYFLNLLMM